MTFRQAWVTSSLGRDALWSKILRKVMFIEWTRNWPIRRRCSNFGICFFQPHSLLGKTWAFVFLEEIFPERVCIAKLSFQVSSDVSIFNMTSLCHGFLSFFISCIWQRTKTTAWNQQHESSSSCFVEGFPKSTDQISYVFINPRCHHLAFILCGVKWDTFCDRIGCDFFSWTLGS